VLVAACLWSVVGAGQAPPNERGPGDPIFVRWLDPDDAGDRTILDYWQRAKSSQLSATQLVDLGTMLFHRGYPKDAVRMYRSALKIDSDLYEAWYRIGLVMHREGELDDARHAYRKCLKLLTGHGWCNFYLGLLEEQTGHPSKALDYYRRAFKFAPELADPEVNHDLLLSDVYLGAALMRNERERFTNTIPMGYLEPDQVEEVKSRYQPTPTPTLEAAPPETPAGAAAAVGPEPAEAAPTVTPTSSQTSKSRSSPFGARQPRVDPSPSPSPQAPSNDDPNRNE
jgi:tetratricopeptide (TPR) repeat protein